MEKHTTPATPVSKWPKKMQRLDHVERMAFGRVLSPTANVSRCQLGCILNCMHILAVSCGAPPTISNGLYKGELFTFGHNVTYHCNVGYERSGSAELECTHTGQWSSSFPNCSGIVQKIVRK